MLNTLDDDEPQEDQYKPDGGYIPRILFINPKTLKVDAKVFNQGRGQYKYFYSTPEEIIRAMKGVSSVLFTDEDNDMRTEEQKDKADRDRQRMEEL